VTDAHTSRAFPAAVGIGLAVFVVVTSLLAWTLVPCRLCDRKRASYLSLAPCCAGISPSCHCCCAQCKKDDLGKTEECADDAATNVHASLLHGSRAPREKSDDRLAGVAAATSFSAEDGASSCAVTVTCRHISPARANVGCSDFGKSWSSPHSRAALRLAILLTSYYALVFAMCCLLFLPSSAGSWAVDREFLWNASQLDTPTGSTRAVVASLMGLPVLFFLSWLLRARFGGRSLLQWLWVLLANKEDSWKALAVDLSYAVEITYGVWLLWTCSLLAIALSVASSAGRVFFLEQWWDDPMIDPASWALRFRCLHLILLSIPLVAVALLNGLVCLLVLLVSRRRAAAAQLTAQTAIALTVLNLDAPPDCPPSHESAVD